MSLSIHDDRMTQLLMAADDGLEADAARLRLERSSIILTFDSMAATESWGQAALLAIAGCGKRMFRGGVFLRETPEAVFRLGHHPATTLRRALLNAGCQEAGMPASAFRIHVGATAPDRCDLYCMADGWRGITSPEPLTAGTDANVLSGVLAGAMATTEAFRRNVLGDLLAARRTRMMSAWDPANPYAGAPLDRLPQKLWLLGGGNLGQATMFVLGLLPYADTAEAALVIQDSDIVGPENLDTQILTEHSWVRRKKARCIADYAEALGFRISVCERRFGPKTVSETDEPRVALVGVDNLKARRWAAASGFDLVLDAGLGRTASEIFDIRLHAFPGLRLVEDAWPVALDDAPQESVVNGGLKKLLAEGRIDLCGQLTIAGRSLGVPSTALAAAVLQVAQACRVLHSGRYCDFIDLALTDTALITAHDATISVALPALGVRA